MKELLIMRHAKSAWNTLVSDFERPLNERGKSDAPLMGKALKKLDKVPDIILASPAQRAKTTAEAVAKTSDYKRDIVWYQKFYLCETTVIADELRKLDKNINRAMVVAHNNTIEYLVAELASNGSLDVRMPTAAIAFLIFDSSWSQLGMNSGQLNWLIIPKLIKPLLK